jgi:hypothetical protein
MRVMKNKATLLSLAVAGLFAASAAHPVVDLNAVAAAMRRHQSRFPLNKSVFISVDPWPVQKARAVSHATRRIPLRGSSATRRLREAYC